MKTNILYVDDEENNLNSFMATFRIKYNVLLALNGYEAIEIMNSQPVKIIISDHRMPNINGIELLEIIKNQHPESIRIIITGYADINDIKKAVEKGIVQHYLEKPWKAEEIDFTMQKAIAECEAN